MLDEQTTPDSKMTPVLSDPWTRAIEEYIMESLRYIDAQRGAHELAKRTNRRCYYGWGLPALLIPCVCAPLTAMLSRDETCLDGRWQTASTCGFIITAICSVMCNFFTFEKTGERHDLFVTKYSEVGSGIRAELVKQKEFRQNADVFVKYVKLTLDHLADSEPDTTNYDCLR